MTALGPLIALITALLAALLVGGLVRSRHLAGFADLPNERSLHARPVGRLGGLGLFGAVALVLTGLAVLEPGAFDPRPPWLVLLAGVALLAGTGAVDDRCRLGAGIRLTVHGIVALAFAGAVLAVLPLPPHEPATTGLAASGMASNAAIAPALPLPRWMVLTLLSLALVWSANLFNFMDGADGVAGLTALLGFLAYAILADPDSVGIRLVALTLAGGTAGFLWWNWSPATVFLGDAGSVPLGFAAAALGILGAWAGDWPWWAPIMIFLPFILDATATLAIRALRGERFWQAHRGHAYQKLVLAGWSHRRVATVYAFGMVPGIVTAGTTRYATAGVLVACCTVIICLTAWLQHRARQQSSRHL